MTQYKKCKLLIKVLSKVLIMRSFYNFLLSFETLGKKGICKYNYA